MRGLASKWSMGEEGCQRPRVWAGREGCGWAAMEGGLLSEQKEESSFFFPFLSFQLLSIMRSRGAAFDSN